MLFPIRTVDGNETGSVIMRAGGEFVIGRPNPSEKRQDGDMFTLEKDGIVYHISGDRNFWSENEKRSVDELMEQLRQNNRPLDWELKDMSELLPDMQGMSQEFQTIFKNAILVTTTSIYYDPVFGRWPSTIKKDFVQRVILNLCHSLRLDGNEMAQSIITLLSQMSGQEMQDEENEARQEQETKEEKPAKKTRSRKIKQQNESSIL